MIPPRYDRTAASAVLAGLVHPGLFTTPTGGERRLIPYTSNGVIAEAGSHLTLSQRLYLEKFMRPCPPGQVTVATHRITWTDSSGVPCTGHYRQGGLGPIMPIAARETTLALWRSLGADVELTARIARLTPDEQAVLAGTTTDQEPREILRIGVEAAGRTLAQHALLSADRPDLDARGFAGALRDGGIFLAVAGQWYWELQASTLRRGMIPVRFTGDGPLRYTAGSVDVLRRMKDATIADAHAVMLKATTVDGLTEEEAVHKYHDELDLISRQYALLAPDTRPHCLARTAIVPALADVYVETFGRLLDVITIEESAQAVADDGDATSFLVPDMNCRHCQGTIRAVLEAMDLTVHEVDLVSKRVTVADFRSPRNRRRAFEAIRDGGYTVIGGA
ncbi:heavy-metal-associated domain-containing protein [Actinoplanes sp. HUAS TT8]|uniref:heavy-metal-associated domain-containing protein n=1 Tax=Actinoplanes sp. HUAS TT8 TaxID=3447453 RepID=UPI003F52710B